MLEQRLDCFLVWGNGLQDEYAIYSFLELCPDIEIIRVIRHRPRSMKRFVDLVYSFDYAPRFHLKGKVRYLKRLDRKEVLCIFVKNLKPKLEKMGEGTFSHVECKKIKQIKETIRSEWNPKVRGVLSNNHVIHATDNEGQAIKILRYIEPFSYERIKRFFKKTLYQVPIHIDVSDNMEMMFVDIDKLTAVVNVGTRWQSKTIDVPILETPHYKYVCGDKNPYIEYCRLYRGVSLKDGHSEHRFDKLIENMNVSTLDLPPILVRESKNSGFRVLDGLHRVAIYKSSGVEKVLVCKI